MINTLLFLFLAPLVFVADRLSKFVVIGRLAEGESIPLTFFFHLTRVSNTGAAFGLLRDSRILLVGTSALCVVFLCVMIARKQSGLSLAASALILGGALGNLYDRLAYGYVVDFLDFRVWPVFNIADSAISIGIGLIFLDLFLRRKHG